MAMRPDREMAARQAFSREAAPKLARRPGPGHRIAHLACGCTRRLGLSAREWDQLWCMEHDWQRVMRIELTAHQARHY